MYAKETALASATVDGKERAAKSKHATTAARRNGKESLQVSATMINANVCQVTVAQIVSKKLARTVAMSLMDFVTAQMANATVHLVSVASTVPLS